MRPATLSQAAPSEAAVTVWGRSCIAAGPPLSSITPRRGAGCTGPHDRAGGQAAPPLLARERGARTRFGKRVDGGGVPGAPVDGDGAAPCARVGGGSGPWLEGQG